MLPRQYRLLKTDYFDLKTVSRVTPSVSFGLLIFPRSDTLPSRFGFVVSKRISKLATVRNHARRLLSEAIYKSHKTLPPGLSVLILVKKNILTQNLENLTLEIKQQFIK